MITDIEWPGPENPGVFSMIERHESFINSISDVISRQDFDTLVNSKLHEYNIDNNDSWDISSAKWWISAWITSLSEICIKYNIQMPDWLHLESEVIFNGKIPVGYTDSSKTKMMTVHCQTA